MQFETTRFGTINVDDEKIVTFPDGLPGFEHLRLMAIIQHPGHTDSPFCWMQCIDDNWEGSGALAFPVISPWMIDEDYSPTLPSSSLQDLGITDIRTQAQFWVIVTIPKVDPGKATVNLLAPVLLNVEQRTGRQVILRNERYSLHTPLAKPSEQRIKSQPTLRSEQSRKPIGVAA